MKAKLPIENPQILIYYNLFSIFSFQTYNLTYTNNGLLILIVFKNCLSIVNQQNRQMYTFSICNVEESFIK